MILYVTCSYVLSGLPLACFTLRSIIFLLFFLQLVANMSVLPGSSHGATCSWDNGFCGKRGRENSKDFFLFFLFSFCSCFQLIPDINCPGSHVAVLWLLQCMRGRKERKAPITYNILYTSKGKKSCILPL